LRPQGAIGTLGLGIYARRAFCLFTMSGKIEIILNGKATEVVQESTVRSLVEDLGLQAGQVAVELNGEIVSRDHWPEKRLVPGDKIEVVHFVGGGSGA